MSRLSWDNGNLASEGSNCHVRIWFGHSSGEVYRVLEVKSNTSLAWRSVGWLRDQLVSQYHVIRSRDTWLAEPVMTHAREYLHERDEGGAQALLRDSGQ